MQELGLNLGTVQERISRWLSINSNNSRSIPYHIDRLMQVEERYTNAKFYPQIHSDELHTEITSALETQYADRGYRRECEHALADYISEVAVSQYTPQLSKLAKKLRSCRMRGAVGMTPQGRTIVAWDDKCGMARLCADESRVETQRIARKYIPALTEFHDARPEHRLQYAVFTNPNFKPGDLATGKKQIFSQFKTWCKAFPQIKGALIVEEDPLSAHGDWNVHLNAILLINDRFDWGRARQEWGSNVHFQALKPKGLVHTMLELVKYSALTVAEKSETKSATSPAPPMTQWSHERWFEWWEAQKHFRRTRAYGVLYALERTRWREGDAFQRHQWLSKACSWCYVPQNVHADWTDFSEKERLAIRKAMAKEERLEMDDVSWLGSINFQIENGSYKVDLIQGNNFSKFRATERDSDLSFYQQSTDPPSYVYQPTKNGHLM